MQIFHKINYIHEKSNKTEMDVDSFSIKLLIYVKFINDWIRQNYLFFKKYTKNLLSTHKFDHLHLNQINALIY